MPRRTRINWDLGQKLRGLAVSWSYLATALTKTESRPSDSMKGESQEMECTESEGVGKRGFSLHHKVGNSNIRYKVISASSCIGRGRE
jgi:hypothetical protein